MKNLMGHLRRMNWMNLKDTVLLRKKRRIQSAELSEATKKCFQDLIDMEKQFELERKYLVLSLDDINMYLGESQKWSLEIIVNELKRQREDSGDEPLEGIFVKESYPFYKDTLQKLEMYVKQQNRKEFTMVSLGGQQMLLMEDINPKRVNRGVCIKVTGKEEFVGWDMLKHLSDGGSAVLNLNEYHISSHPIKGDQIMLQIRERHNGFTHFFQTTKTSLRAMLKEVM